MPEIRRVIDELKEMKGSSPWTRTVIVDIGGKGDFTSVKAACDYIETQTHDSNHRWLITVKPGNYNESPFSVPAYTLIAGEYTTLSQSSSHVKITFSNTEGTCITLNDASGLYFLQLYLLAFTCTGNLVGISRISNASTISLTDVYIYTATISNTYSITGFLTAGTGANILRNVIFDVANFGTGGSIGISNPSASTCYIDNPSFPLLNANLDGIVQNNAGGSCLIRGGFIQTSGTGVCLKNIAGTIVVNNVSYASSSGAITHGDRKVSNDAQGTYQSGSATQIVRIFKGAAAQSANLTEWKNSSDTVLASMDKDGKISAAGFSAGASAGVSGSFTTVDGKTVTVTNGIITAIV